MLLRLGSEGVDVKAWQTFLSYKYMGLYHGAIDGVFGPQTRDATVAFQQLRQQERQEESQPEDPSTKLVVQNSYPDNNENSRSLENPSSLSYSLTLVDGPPSSHRSNDDDANMHQNQTSSVRSIRSYGNTTISSHIPSKTQKTAQLMAVEEKTNVRSRLSIQSSIGSNAVTTIPYDNSGIVDAVTLNQALFLGFLHPLVPYSKHNEPSERAYVWAWQTFLRTATPYDPGRPDGLFGPTTQSATQAFQAHYQLPRRDGTVDGATIVHAAQNQGFFTFILQLGTRGPDVVDWQSFLNQHYHQKNYQTIYPPSAALLSCGRVDGVFGPTTQAATRSFQAWYGLIPFDGIVGSTTVAQAQSLGFAVASATGNYKKMYYYSNTNTLASTASSSFPPPNTWNVMIDISHYQKNVDFTKVKASGVQAVIAKSSEGYGYTDPTYHKRKQQALQAGLLWGAYHFGTGTAVDLQLKHFFNVVQPDHKTLLVLDWEENPSGTQMTLSQARQFVQGVYNRTHRWPVLYGGKLLRDTMERTGGDAILNNCPLWVAAYRGTTPELPKGWSQYTFWQYTNGNKGPHPRTVDGISPAGCDRSIFQASTTYHYQPMSSSTTSTVVLAELYEFWNGGGSWV